MVLESQLPHEIVNLLFTFTNENKKLTFLWGTSSNHSINTSCETRVWGDEWNPRRSSPRARPGREGRSEHACHHGGHVSRHQARVMRWVSCTDRAARARGCGLHDHPGDNRWANGWFIQSTPIQMLPPEDSICGSLT